MDIYCRYLLFRHNISDPLYSLFNGMVNNPNIQLSFSAWILVSFWRYRFLQGDLVRFSGLSALEKFHLHTHFSRLERFHLQTHFRILLVDTNGMIFLNQDADPSGSASGTLSGSASICRWQAKMYRIWAYLSTFQRFEPPIFQKNRHQENVLRGGGHVHQEAAGEDDWGRRGWRPHTGSVSITGGT